MPEDKNDSITIPAKWAWAAIVALLGVSALGGGGTSLLAMNAKGAAAEAANESTSVRLAVIEYRLKELERRSESIETKLDVALEDEKKDARPQKFEADGYELEGGKSVHKFVFSEQFESSAGLTSCGTVEGIVVESQIADGCPDLKKIGRVVRGFCKDMKLDVAVFKKWRLVFTPHWILLRQKSFYYLTYGVTSKGHRFSIVTTNPVAQHMVSVEAVLRHELAHAASVDVGIDKDTDDYDEEKRRKVEGR